MGNKLKKFPSCYEPQNVHNSIILEHRKSEIVRSSANNRKRNQTNPKIIWHDPKIFKKENKKFYDDFLETLNIDRFDNYKKANQMILDSNDSTFIVMTSGTDGEKFVKMIHDQTNVLWIIIFCKKSDLHKKWAQNFKKIVSVTSQREKAYEVLKILKPDSLITNDLNENKNNQNKKKVITNPNNLNKKKIIEAIGKKFQRILIGINAKRLK